MPITHCQVCLRGEQRRHRYVEPYNFDGVVLAVCVECLYGLHINVDARARHYLISLARQYAQARLESA